MSVEPWMFAWPRSARMPPPGRPMRSRAGWTRRAARTLWTPVVCWGQPSAGHGMRAASTSQPRLGNIGRPGGGILALRGHANIQGSTDIPTLYNILPGYIPMPHPQSHPTLETFVEKNGPDTGAWGSLKSYMVSLLKAWWGDAATVDNDFCFDRLPRIDGDHSIYPTMV